MAQFWCHLTITFNRKKHFLQFRPPTTTTTTTTTNRKRTVLTEAPSKSGKTKAERSKAGCGVSAADQASWWGTISWSILLVSTSWLSNNTSLPHHSPPTDLARKKVRNWRLSETEKHPGPIVDIERTRCGILRSMIPGVRQSVSLCVCHAVSRGFAL